MQPYHISKTTVIDAEAMASNISSDILQVGEMGCYCVQAVWSAGASPVGSLSLQASNDGITFTEVSSGSVSGNSGSLMFNVERHAYEFIQLVYTATSGDATMTATVNGKKG